MRTTRKITFRKEFTIQKEDTFEYILHEIKQVEKEDIVHIYLDKIDDLNAEKLALLIITVYLLSKIVSQAIYIKAPKEMLDYLYSIGFYGLGYVSRMNTELEKTEHYHIIIPVKKFVGIKGRGDLLVSVRNIGGDDGEILNKVLPVVKNLSENCLEHTSIDPDKIDCFAFTERANGRMCIVIIDFGEGFFESFVRAQKTDEIKNSSQAIKKILENNMSSKIDRHIGYGLQQVKDLVTKNNGRMIIASGGVLAVYHQERVYLNVQIPFFQGSCIYVEI